MEIMLKIMSLLGFLSIWCIFLNYLVEKTKYYKTKTYQLKNKQVCDMCFKNLKECKREN